MSKRPPHHKRVPMDPLPMTVFKKPVHPYSVVVRDGYGHPRYVAMIGDSVIEADDDLAWLLRVLGPERVDCCIWEGDRIAAVIQNYSEISRNGA